MLHLSGIYFGLGSLHFNGVVCRRVEKTLIETRKRTEQKQQLCEPLGVCAVWGEVPTGDKQTE